MDITAVEVLFKEAAAEFAGGQVAGVAAKIYSLFPSFSISHVSITNHPCCKETALLFLPGLRGPAQIESWLIKFRLSHQFDTRGIIFYTDATFC